MVRTRSRGASQRETTTPISYTESANTTPSITSPKKRASPTKQATSTSTTSASTRKSPKRKSMAVADEIVVKSEHDGSGSGLEKHPPRPSDKASTRRAGAKGKPAHKIDKSGHFEFGGTFGTSAMMIFFTILMYYLWICLTFHE